jgi:hypothetical protein
LRLRTWIGGVVVHVGQMQGWFLSGVLRANDRSPRKYPPAEHSDPKPSCLVEM